MEMPSVVAFTDSPVLRETLAVVLEHQCVLRFVAPAVVPSLDDRWADLVVVATRNAVAVANDLRRQRPQLPIVAVTASDARTSTLPACGVDTVPLEPTALQEAVLRCWLPIPDAALRRAIERVAGTWKGDLGYSLTALRSLSALAAASSRCDTRAILSSVMQEQRYVLEESLGYAQRFCGRPRAAALSPEFVPALLRQLECADDFSTYRGLFCECAFDEGFRQTPGPVALVPDVATFLRAQFRRRSDSPVIRVRATRTGVEASYPPRSAKAAPAGSWPLLLTTAALFPWNWEVERAESGREETITLRPAD